MGARGERLGARPSGWANGLTATGGCISMPCTGPKRNPSLVRNLFPHDLHHAPAQGDGPFHALTLARRQVLHFEELEFREEAGQRVVQCVLEALLRG